MAIIKYQVKENNNLGTHSFYGVAQSYSTLDFEDLADDVVDRYMLVAKRNVLRGHRVKFGDLLTIYPQLSCSVKDEMNDDGTVKKAATIEMFNLAGAKSSIGATISQNVQQSFASSVSWKRVADTDDSDTTENNPETTDDQESTTDTGDGGNTTGGGTDDQGGSTQPPSGDGDDDGVIS